jgi:ribose 1,5-bisphosphokinase
VVVNVSRGVIDAMRGAYADVVVVLVTAPPDVLAQRLALRARGSDGQIETRLSRAVDDALPDATIINIGDAQDHARQLVEIIRSR